MLRPTIGITDFTKMALELNVVVFNKGVILTPLTLCFILICAMI